jgi:(E)-4-hydroxy-3-methylbut-2-enyl-diphosphate synthase
LLSVDEIKNGKDKTASRTLNFVRVTSEEMDDVFLSKIGSVSNAVLLLSSSNQATMAALRNAFFRLAEKQINCPVILYGNYPDATEDSFMLHASTDTGTLLIDGFGDGVMFNAPLVNTERINSISFGILQAARARISKTEYISCPSCGRTLFDLQETTAKIRRRTEHLKGLKIAVMGCIVNGPGEMADADYGYVGSGPGKITLYKGKEIVKRNVPSEEAVEELVGLIRDHGDWVEMNA